MVSDFDGDDCIFSLLTRGEVKGRRQQAALRQQLTRGGHT
jgi:hypothetical protein